MKTIWTAGLDKGDKEDIEASFRHSPLLRERLSKILKDKLSNARREGHTKEGYDCPNWAYKKADESGYIRALSEVISIIS